LNTTQTIIEQAHKAGVQLSVRGDKLVLRGPEDAVKVLVPVLRAHKTDIMRTLTEPGPDDPEEPSAHWLIIVPAERSERFFNPPVTRVELEQRYLGALLIPLPDDTSPLPPQYRIRLDGP
jgi:hypothetical protein